MDDLSDRSLPTKAFSLQTHPLQSQPSNPQSDQVWFINPDHVVSQYQGCTECPLVSESHYKHGMGAGFSFESENILKKLETRFALLERCKENENLMQCWSLTKSNFNNCSTRKPLSLLKYSNSRFSLPSPAETVENLSSSALSKALSNSGSALSERAFDDSENLSTKGENQNLSRKSRIKRQVSATIDPTQAGTYQWWSSMISLRDGYTSASGGNCLTSNWVPGGPQPVQVEPNSVMGISSFSGGPSNTSNAAFLNTGKCGSLSSTNYTGETQSTRTTLDSRDSSLATLVLSTALLPHHQCKSSEGMHIPPVPPLPKDYEPFKASNYGSPQIQYPPHSTSQIKNSSTKADNQSPDRHLLFKVNTATSTLNLASSNPSSPPGGLVATSSSLTSATSRFLHSLSSHKASEDSINLGRGGRGSSVAAKWAKMAASEKAKLSSVEKSLSKSLRKGNDGSEALKSGASSGIFISNRAISIREREPKANAITNME
ncbi:hypothetical protein BY996DRAFT_6411071 [Phakopsora pachyrhizi]|nr:hypothetical protein BY996DRAFT_6411071 [Phakopsora pachyrhizi]